MLEIEIYSDGFTINGHAEYDEYGKDIVCSAVSFLSQTIAEEMQSLDTVTVQKFSGFMGIKLHTISMETKTLLEYFDFAVRKLAQQYPENVQIKEI